MTENKTSDNIYFLNLPLIRVLVHAQTIQLNWVAYQQNLSSDYYHEPPSRLELSLVNQCTFRVGN